MLLVDKGFLLVFFASPPLTGFLARAISRHVPASNPRDGISRRMVFSLPQIALAIFLARSLLVIGHPFSDKRMRQPALNQRSMFSNLVADRFEFRSMSARRCFCPREIAIERNSLC